MREGEEDGVSYHFVDDATYKKMMDDGILIAPREFEIKPGEFWKYATPITELQEDKAIIIDPSGLHQLKRIQTIKPVIFYLMASDGILWNRLRHRGDDSIEARRRINSDAIDFADIETEYDFAIRNDGDMLAKNIAEMILYLYRKKKEVLPRLS